jgi:nickel/cobalt transporter (NicO) family protein
MCGLYHGRSAFANWNGVDPAWGVGVYACVHSFQDYLTHGQGWLFLPAAVLLGALHGLEPGHSKTMMAAFIISIRGTVAQAVLLGLSAAFSHTLVIWVLAAIGLHFSGQLDVEGLEPWFQVVTGVIIVGMAAWMFTRIRRDQRAASHQHQPVDEHQQRGAHGGPMLATGANEQTEISVFETNVPPRFRLFFHDKDGQPMMPPTGQIISLETSRPDGSTQVFEFISQGDYLESASNIPEPHEFNVGLKISRGGGPITCYTSFVEHHHHSHGVKAGEFQDAHEREHAQELQSRFAGQSVTTRQVVLFGLTGGLMPCPAAFAVLLVCLQIKQFTLGFAVVLAFSLGLAITLVTVGSVAALSVRAASRRFAGFAGLARRLPYASVGLISLIGVVLATLGLKHILH